MPSESSFSASQFSFSASQPIPQRLKRWKLPDKVFTPGAKTPLLDEIANITVFISTRSDSTAAPSLLHNSPEQPRWDKTRPVKLLLSRQPESDTHLPLSGAHIRIDLYSKVDSLVERAGPVKTRSLGTPASCGRNGYPNANEDQMV